MTIYLHTCTNIYIHLLESDIVIIANKLVSCNKVLFVTLTTNSLISSAKNDRFFFWCLLSSLKSELALLKKHREEVAIIDIVNMTVKTTNPVRQLAILPKTQSYFTPIVRYKKKHSFASYKMIISNMCYPFYTQINIYK